LHLAAATAVAGWRSGRHPLFWRATKRTAVPTFTPAGWWRSSRWWAAS